MVRLEVQSLASSVSGYGVVAITEAQLAALEIAVDDFVELTAGGETVHRAVRTASDGPSDIVAVDARTREQLGVTEGDTVEVAPISVPRARRITVDCLDVPSTIDRDDLRLRLSHRVVSAGQTVSVPINTTGGNRELAEVVVTDVVPTGTVGTTPATTIKFGPEVTETDQTSAPTAPQYTDECVTYDDIGGMDEVVRQLREVVELPLAEAALFERLGVTPPSGVLLYGPPGTGKTRLARAVANEASAHFVSLDATATLSKWVGETEENIREVFDEARQNAPAIVYIDEIDALASNRADGKNWEARAVTELLTQLDGLNDDDQVICIASTNRIDALDPAIRRPGRFDRELEVSRPDTAGRREILAIHTQDVPLAADVELADIAARTVGYTGADIAALVSEAVMAAVRRLRGSDTDTASTTPDDEFRVLPTDIETGLAATAPSGLRGHTVELPTTEWSDIGGLADAKAQLKRSVVWPQQYPEVYDAAAIEPGAGVLLHGPPGTGKTLLARAVATATNATVLPVAGPDLVAARPGETEAGIRRLFQRARAHAPCVVIIDEIDALVQSRADATTDYRTERAATQLLTELDGLTGQTDVTLVGTTNCPERIDDALLRPGRLGTTVHVALPDIDARRQILEIHLRERPLAPDVEIGDIARRTDGYSGADLAALCRIAAQLAVHRTIETTRDPDTGLATTMRLTHSDMESAMHDIDSGDTVADARSNPPHA